MKTKKETETLFSLQKYAYETLKNEGFTKISTSFQETGQSKVFELILFQKESAYIHLLLEFDLQYKSIKAIRYYDFFIDKII